MVIGLSVPSWDCKQAKILAFEMVGL